MCETEIKVRQHGGYTILAVVLVLLGLGLVGANKVCLDKMNRLHAIARGDIYSEVMRARPPLVFSALSRRSARMYDEPRVPPFARRGAGARGRDDGDGACAAPRRLRPLHRTALTWRAAQFAAFTIKFFIIKSLFTFTAVVRPSRRPLGLSRRLP